MNRRIIHVIFILHLFSPCHLKHHIAYNIPDPECTGIFNLCTDLDKERIGRLAVKTIHEQMDDDKDGMIEITESQEFIQEELESKTDSIRHRNFQSADLQITFNDLWSQWENSDVYNWTTDGVVDWLVNHVDLPQYVDNFRRNQFDGRMIPRLAANEKHYLSSIMHIRDPRHKHRLIIKATDVVLFGAPPHTHNLLKDVILISAVAISLAACLYAYIRHRKTQENMKVMLKELETLQKAEGDLVAVTGKMKAMENELKEKPKVDRGLLNAWFVEVQQTKEEAEKLRKHRDTTHDHEKQLRLALQEIEQLRIALRKAEEHAQHQSYEVPSELIDLLKKTYLNEEVAFELKRKSAENAMMTAKEQMIRVSKMQRGFLGAVRIAHTGCIENISELISSAKERLLEVQDEYEEREKRWNRIAALLDREDLVSNASSSSASLGGNQYFNTTNATNNWTGTVPPDTYARSKQSSIDSTNLINTNHETSSMTKSNSGSQTRGIPINPIIEVQTAEQESSSLGTEHSFGMTDSPSMVLKRRTMTHTHANSTERLSPGRQISNSHSANNLNQSLRNSADFVRQQTDDSLDILPASRSARPVFDLMSDPNDNLLDDSDGKSQLSFSTHEDQQSIASSSEKKRKQRSSRLLRPFQNILFRKKSMT